MAVARSAFPSQNVQNTSAPHSFLKYRCPKVVGCCGAKCVFKSKCPKQFSNGPLFEVPMSKYGTPLVREAHFQVKMFKTPHARTTFTSSDVEKWHAAMKSKCTKHRMLGPLFQVPKSKNGTVARFSNQNVQSTTQSVNSSISQLVNQSVTVVN